MKNRFDTSAENVIVIDWLKQKAEELLAGDNFTIEQEVIDKAHKIFQDLYTRQQKLELHNEELRIYANEVEKQKIKLSNLFELAPVCYLVLSNRGIITDVNLTGTRLFGFNKKYLCGKALSDFIQADDLAVYYNFLHKMLSGASEHQCNLRLLVFGKKASYLQLNGVCNGGTHQGALCFITMSIVAEIEQPDLRVKEAHKRVDKALKASSTGLWEIALANGDVYLDDFSAKLFGQIPNHFNKKYSDLLALIDLDDRVRVDTTLRSAILRDKNFNIEFGVKHESGMHKTLAALGQVIDDTDGGRKLAGMLTDITEKKHLEMETLRLRENQKNMLTAAGLLAEEKDRERISELLHDNVGQVLYAIKLNLQHLNNVDKNDIYYSQVNQLLDQTIQDIRNLSFDLAPTILKDFGLAATLDEMAKRLSSPTLAIYTKVAVGSLETSLMFNIYRIIQELVNSSIKHAQASHIWIKVFLQDQNIHISVTDDGLGLQKDETQASLIDITLGSIRNRLSLYKGVMDVTSLADSGTRVDVVLKVVG